MKKQLILLFTLIFTGIFSAAAQDPIYVGKINYWTMCKQLKKVMAECGIEKQISYHCARHHHLSYTLKISSL